VIRKSLKKKIISTAQCIVAMNALFESLDDNNF